MAEINPTPALILYGPEDHVFPITVDGAGHFLQWERADVLNGALRWFCRDLLGQSVAS